MNKAIIIGNLGKDPEVRYTNNGNAVAQFSVATSERWTDKGGEAQERTDWHNIVVWGKQGENCGQYLSKGSKVCVEGSIRTRNYDDKDGVKRYVTEIIAQRVEFLNSKGGGGRRDDPGPQEDDAGGRGKSDGGKPDLDDDIPF
jgi:single-strand DNA-binding protein